MDFFTVPTATLRVLFVFLVLKNERRNVAHFNVTESPNLRRVLVDFFTGILLSRFAINPLLTTPPLIRSVYSTFLRRFPDSNKPDESSIFAGI